MTKKHGIYRCEICGNMVEVLHEGKGELVCCGKPMKLLEENTEDASREKHVPAVEKTEDGIIVRVGSAIHPMEEKHYIGWIEVIADDKVYRQDLKAGELPEAEFKIKSDNMTVRAYCNLHGLWKA